MYIVRFEVPSLIWLDITFQQAIIIYIRKNFLQGKDKTQKLPVEWNTGNSLIIPSNPALRFCFAKKKLIKIHTDFV